MFLAFCGKIVRLRKEKKQLGEKLIYQEKRSDPDWIRTNDLLLRRQLLYPAELRDQKRIADFGFMISE